MIIKNIKTILAILTVGFGLTVTTACSSEENPFFTIDENDAPRILNTDIPEGSNGEPGTIMSIDRTQNFTFEAIVTPINYTIVTWYINGTQVAEGKTIDINLLAGEYELKIVATTTMGLETSRTTKLIVRAIEGDPVPGNKQKERLVKPGTQVTLHGDNMEKVTTVIIGDREIKCTYNTKGYLEYTIPSDLAEGVYQLKLADSERMIYGGGTITISLDPDYTIEETVLWEGHHYVSWEKADGDPNKTFSATQAEFTKLPAGAIISVYYSIEESAEYHQLQLMSAWWTLLPGHEKIEFSEGGIYEYTITDEAIALCTKEDGFLIGGHGFYVDKVIVKQ